MQIFMCCLIGLKSADVSRHAEIITALKTWKLSYLLCI